MTSGLTQSVGMGAAVLTTARPTDASTRLTGSIEKSSKIRKHLQDIADAASFSFALVERENASSASVKRVESTYSPKKGRPQKYYPDERDDQQPKLDIFA
jgi:hypothetical protein